MISSLMVYLIKVSIGSIVLFLCYYIFFRRETFYKRNRLILMLALILPLIIPVLDFSELFKPSNDYQSHFSAVQSFAVSSQYVESGISGTIEKLSFIDLLFSLYIIGLAFSVLKILTGIFTVIRTIDKGEKTTLNGVEVVLTDLNYPPYSFFTTIVFPRSLIREGEYDSILLHEKAHIDQKHFIDLLLAELFLAFQWFNPAAWLLRKSIAENHEFLADKLVATKLSSSRRYQLSLLELCNGGKIIPLAHNFNKRIIKKRINMMNKVKTKNIARIKNILIVPATVLLLATITAGSYAIIQKPGKSPFTEISEQGILDHIKYVTKFPKEVAMANYQDVVYIQMKVNNNNIEELQIFNSPEKVTAPILDDIVIIALEADDDVVNKKKTDAEYRDLLFREGERVARKVSRLDIAEWIDKSIEFTLKLDYRLTPNVASITNISKAAGTNNMSYFAIEAAKDGRKPLFIINDEIYSLKDYRYQFGQVRSGFRMSSKTAAGLELFGEKGRDGYSWEIAIDKMLDLSLGEYLDKTVKNNRYPLFTNTSKIITTEELDSYDREKTKIMYTIEADKAQKLFGDKAKYGAAIISRPFFKK